MMPQFDRQHNIQLPSDQILIGRNL
ncbi:hypothetical protein MED222_04950 [Vibrio sp. MED222]|nr:hypothetical protein MED222_04950 [Vibrio sp. MED222]